MGSVQGASGLALFPYLAQERDFYRRNEMGKKEKDTDDDRIIGNRHAEVITTSGTGRRFSGVTHIGYESNRLRINHAHGYSVFDSGQWISFDSWYV